MKTIFKISVCLLLLFSISERFSLAGGATYTWTNKYSTGDQKFSTADNWDPARYEPNIVDDFLIDYLGFSSDVCVLDTDVIGRHVRVASALNSVGELHITGGNNSFSHTLLLGGFSAGYNSYGKAVMTGGELEFQGSTTIGNRGTGVFELVNGIYHTLDVSLGSLAEGVGYVDITGGELLVKEYVSVAKSGAGTFTLDGGIVSCNRVTVGQNSGGNGLLVVNGGLFEVDLWVAVGTAGVGSIEVHGGVFNADRMNVGQQIGANGTILLTGGEVNFNGLVEIGRAGTANLKIYGDAGKFRCGELSVNALSTVNLVFDGSAGVGTGIQVLGGKAAISGTIAPSFISGTETGGNYIVMSAIEGISDLSESGILSASAISAGWSEDIVNVGRGGALLLSYPLSGGTATWTNAAGTQLWSHSANWSEALSSTGKAVIDLDGTEGAILESSTTVNSVVVGDIASGSLVVNMGANGQFHSLTIGDANTASGSMTVSGGAIDVNSAAIVGKDGFGELSIAAGAFSAQYLIAGSGEGSGSIDIGGAAVVSVDQILGIGAESELTVSGSMADISVGGINAAEGSVIHLQFDGEWGIGEPIFATDFVDLNGVIKIQFSGEREVGTYTVIRTEGQLNVNTEGRLIVTPFCNYEIVKNGDYQELQVTVYSPETCDEIVRVGWTLPGDLNKDCRVDFADFVMLAKQWLWCNDPEDLECDPFIF